MINWILTRDKLPEFDDSSTYHPMLCCVTEDHDEYWYCIGYYSKDIGWYEHREKLLEEQIATNIDISLAAVSDGNSEYDVDVDGYKYSTNGCTVTIRYECPDDYIKDNWINDKVVAWCPLSISNPFRE